MSDAVMVPREPTEAMVKAAQVYCQDTRPGRAIDIYRTMIAAAPALAASTPVGGWEEAEREEALALLRTINRECDIGQHEADVLSIIDRLAAPPPPSVSTDKGSRPQEAVPSEGHDAAAVDWQVLIDGGWRDTPDPDYWRGIGHEVRSLKTGPAVPLTGHARHLTEVPFPNGMRLTIVRENSYDAVTIWSEDGESIFTQACVAPQPADGCSSNEGAG